MHYCSKLWKLDIILFCYKEVNIFLLFWKCHKAPINFCSWMKFANIVFPPTVLVKLPSQHCSITEKEDRHNSKESLEAEQRLTTGQPTLLLQYLELEKAETDFSKPFLWSPKLLNMESSSLMKWIPGISFLDYILKPTKSPILIKLCLPLQIIFSSFDLEIA